jgi:hypothetical protein
MLRKGPITARVERQLKPAEVVSAQPLIRGAVDRDATDACQGGRDC